MERLLTQVVEECVEASARLEAVVVGRAEVVEPLLQRSKYLVTPAEVKFRHLRCEGSHGVRGHTSGVRGHTRGRPLAPVGGSASSASSVSSVSGVSGVSSTSTSGVSSTSTSGVSNYLCLEGHLQVLRQQGTACDVLGVDLGGAGLLGFGHERGAIFGQRRQDVEGHCELRIL